MTNLKYHQATFDLIKRTPTISEGQLAEIDKRAIELGVQFPAAVRELYSIEGIYELIRFYSNTDYLCEPNKVGKLSPGNSLEELGNKGWYYKPNLVTFLHENEGIFILAFELDGSDDPPVWYWGDGYCVDDNPIWVKVDKRFSAFIYSWVWDFLYFSSGITVVAISEELREADLVFLQSVLKEVRLFLEVRPFHNDLFFQDSRNFEGLGSHLKISKDFAAESSKFVWWLEASTEEEFYNLAKIVVQCSGFMGTKFNTFKDQSLSLKTKIKAGNVLSLLFTEERKKQTKSSDFPDAYNE